MAAAKLLHQAKGQVKVPTFLVPATQKVWADVYSLPVPGCDGRTSAEIFKEAGCETPASPSCAACLGKITNPSFPVAARVFIACMDVHLVEAHCQFRI